MDMMAKPHAVCWRTVCTHKWALPLMETFPHLVRWDKLPCEEWTLPLLERYPYLVKKKMRLRPWNIHIAYLYPNLIDWNTVAFDEWAKGVIERHIDRIPDTVFLRSDSIPTWMFAIIASNPSSAPMISLFNRLCKICYQTWQQPLICAHQITKDWEAAALVANPNRVDWANVCYQLVYGRQNDRLTQLAMSHPRRIDWAMVTTGIIYSNKSHLMPLAMAHLDYLDWYTINTNLRYGTSKHSVVLLSARPQLFDIDLFNRGICTLDEEILDRLIPVLRQIPDIVNLKRIPRSRRSECLGYELHALLDRDLIKLLPVGFTYEFAAMRKERRWMFEEMVEFLYHPKRIAAWLEAGNELESYLP